MSSARFVHLNAHSSFTLLEAMPSVKSLAARAAELNMPALGITDTDNTFGTVEASRYLPEKGVQPILGTQLGVFFGEEPLQKSQRLTLLVQNEEGWRNLLRLSSQAFLDTPDGLSPQVSFKAVQSNAAGLIVLTGNPVESPVTAHLLGEEQDAKQAQQVLQQLAQTFDGRLYVDIQRHGWDAENRTEEWLVEQAYALGLPLVATNDARFLTSQQHHAHKVMLAIKDGLTLDHATARSYTPEHALKSAQDMCALFADMPEATDNTLVVAQRCAFVAPTGMHYMPAWQEGMVSEGTQHRPSPEEVDAQLRREAAEGLRERMEKFVFSDKYSPEERESQRQQYTARLEEELRIIIGMGYAGYFMITSDFIRWALEQGIPVGPGRGSGAGSLVAWALKITNLDPIAWGLYFERFLNPERVSLPDFDIDFCQERRDEVIDYVARKYGKDCVSQIITFGTLKARACIRDVGRVLGMPFGQVGQIAAFIPEGPASIPIAQALESEEGLKELYNRDDDVKSLLDIAMQLEGCYRHASTHAAGIIIADRPIHEVCGLYKDPRSDMPATQWSMNDAEFAGLVKFDFLGLKTLTVVKQAVDLIAAQGTQIDIDLLPLDDPPTFELLKAGATVGVFQVESRGMTDYLKKIVPDRMQYLSDVIALYRPGPLGSGMADDFIECRHGRKDAAYPHPILQPILKETFGVPVYQEQVMRMAQVMAGYTLGGADLLRRAMGKKKPEEMAKQRSLFVSGSAQTNQIEEAKANEVFDLMAHFAGYGFNKAHTIAYAFVSYQTAYLKANYPLAFMAASMTLDRGNSDKVLKFKQELDRMGVTLLPPDVNRSTLTFSVEGEGIRYALGALKGAGDEAMKALVQEREQNGAYTDIWDFLGRQTPKHINRKQLEVLIKAGALDTLEENRAYLLNNINILLGYIQSKYEEKNSNQIGLFGGAQQKGTEEQRPQLAPCAPWDVFTRLEQEQQAVGFYLSAHPMQSYAAELQRMDGLCPLREIALRAEKGSFSARVAGIMIAKRDIKTKSGKKMAILTLSDTSGDEEAVLFPEAYDTYFELLEKNRPLLASVQAVIEGERLRVSVEGLQCLEAAIAQRHATLKVRLQAMQGLVRLRELLAEQPNGATLCHIVYPHPKLGEVQLKLSQRITLSRRFTAQLETIEGVEVLPS